MASKDDTLFIPFGSYDEADRLTASFLPEGEYTVKIKQVETTKIKNGPNAGTPGVVVWFEVVEGDFAGHFQNDRFYVMDSTLWRLAWFLRTVGIKVTKRDMSLPTKQLVGRTLKITTKEGDPYKGNPKSEVSAYNPAAKTATVETETFAADELVDPWESTGFQDKLSNKAVEEVKAADLPADRADEILGNQVRNDYADDWALDSSVTI